MFSTKNTKGSIITELPKFRMAKITNQFDNIRVVIGSDENIFEETYVTCLLQNDRAVKFKKTALEFA